jgi:psiF repeat
MMLRALLLGMALSCTAHAQEKKPTAQQERMADCNKKASGMKGDERKAFMSRCLKDDKAPSAAQKAQQERMADCNKQAAAKSMKGDERKAFMSSCLKDKPQDRMAKCNKEATGKKGDERKKFMSECLKA